MIKKILKWWEDRQERKLKELEERLGIVRIMEIDMKTRTIKDYIK